MEIKIRCQLDDNNLLDVAATKVIVNEKLKEVRAQQLKEREEEKAAAKVSGPIVSRSILNLQKQLILCHEDKIIGLRLIKDKGIEEAANILAATLKFPVFHTRVALEKLRETAFLVSDGLIEQVLPSLVLHIKTVHRAQPRPLTENYFESLAPEKAEELKDAVIALYDLKEKLMKADQGF